MTNVYKIAVEIALAGTIAQGLRGVAAQLTGIHGQVSQIQGGLNRWAMAVGGIASVMGGVAIFKGMEKAVTAGGELVKQQTLLRNMGVEYADVMETTAAAQRATTTVIGTTISENLKGMRELMGVMPNLAEARLAYPAVMQASKVLEALTGAPADQSLQTLAKAIELRGGGMNPKTHELDPERFTKEAEAATRAIIASGGLVNAAALLQFMKTAGPMARMMENADTFYKGALTSIMDMGGFRAGTALTAVGRQLLGGKMSFSTAEEMARIGLLQQGKFHKSGGGTVVDPGGLQGETILKDPTKGIQEWMNKILLPAFAAAGIKSGSDVQQELYKVFGTETARRLAGLYIQNQAQIKRDADLYDKVLPDSYANLAKGDLGANVKNFSDSFTNLLQAFGSPLVPKAIDALQAIGRVVNSMAAGALAHPEAMKVIGEAMIALSAGLVALGTAAVIGAAAALIPGGVIGAAIVGIGAAVAALAAMNWQTAGKALSAIENGVAALFVGLGHVEKDAVVAFEKVAAAIGRGLESIPGLLVGAIERMATGLATEIAHAIANIAGKIGGLLPGAAPGGSSPRQGNDSHRMHASSGIPPAGSGHTIVLNHQTILDGRVLARSSSTHLARMYSHPTQAPAPDAYGAYRSPDAGLVTT